MNKYEFKYPLTELSPLSQKALECHLVHLEKYVSNLEKLSDDPVDTILRQHADVNPNTLVANPIYNNAAQIANHHFFFDQLIPKEDQPQLTDANLKQLIDGQFGDFSKFTTAVVDIASKAFGSNWTWVLLDKTSNVPRLRLCNTINAGTYISNNTQPLTPLLLIDMWEHSYYVDYQYDRTKYLTDIFDLIDWSVIEQRFKNTAL